MDDNKEQLEATSNLIKSALTHAAAPLRYTVKAVKGASGRAMVIKDTVEKLPVLRLDYPHAGHNYAHWNVNWKLLWKASKAHDPHAPASALALRTGEAVNKTAVVLEKVGPALAVAAIAVDSVRLGHAAYCDYQAGTAVPEKTLKTTANVTGAYAGGYGGAVAGGAVGAKVGAGIGWLFGPAGTLAGAAIGGVAGGVGGAVGGAFGGAAAAEKATDKVIAVASDADKRAEVVKAATTAGATVYGAAAIAGSATASAAQMLASGTVAAGQAAGHAAAASMKWAASFMPEALMNQRPKI